MRTRSYQKRGLKFRLRFICYLLFILVIGCEKNTAFIEKSVCVEDQVFTLSEKASPGTLVGQVNVSNQDNSPLRYYLLSGDRSKAFRMEESTGKLFVTDTTAISYDKVQHIDLEVMVSYLERLNDYGVFASIRIDIIDEKFPFTLNRSVYKEGVVNSINPDQTIELNDVFYISAWTVNFNVSVIRTFLQFDLNAIPMDAEIEHAYLNLYNPHDTVDNHTHSKFNGSNAFYIRKVNSQWEGNTLTWNSQPAFSTDGQVLVGESKDENDDYSVDVTEIVKSMVKYPGSNYGFVMMLENESYYRRVCFAGIGNQFDSIRPQLIVFYQY